MNNLKTLTSVKMISFALIGIFFFFITINYNGHKTIPLDHLEIILSKVFEKWLKYYVLIMIIGGSILPFYRKTWNKTLVSKIMSIFKIIGAILAFMYVFNVGPALLFQKDILPFMFEKLVIKVSLIIPLGCLFLSFLVDYGFLELIGVFLQPIMRKIWKTPGKSAIDAVASFVGSYSIGLLITGKIYRNNGYSLKEAMIIATGFSTVSVAFMVVIAKILNIMPHWNVFLWTTMLISVIVTAITARIYPIRNADNKSEINDQESEKQSIKDAFENSLEICRKAGSVLENLKKNMEEGMFMTMSILASILSIGTIGLVLAKFTPVFKVLGLVFYPFVYLLKIPNPMAFCTAIASSLAEMVLPAIMLAEASLIERFVGGIVCITSIIFFSASIPCILANGIQISIKNLIIIWFERVILTLLIAAPVTYLLINYNVIH